MIAKFAVVTFKRPLSGMDQVVSHQGVFADKPFAAVCARVTDSFVIKVVVFQKAPPGGEGLSTGSAGVRQRRFLRYRRARFVLALYVPGQRYTVSELLATLPAEERVFFGVFLLMLQQVRVGSESFGAMRALERLVTGVLPLVSDEAL